MTECSRPRRGMIMVASHFNGWYGIFVVGGRAVGTRHIADDSRVPKGTLSIHLLYPAILGRAKRQSRAEMAGYPYQMPTASSRGDSTIPTKSSHVIFSSSLKGSIFWALLRHDCFFRQSYLKSVMCRNRAICLVFTTSCYFAVKSPGQSFPPSIWAAPYDSEQV